MIVYRVYHSSYEGEWTLAGFADKEEAIAYARHEARASNEEFGGMVGYGTGIEVLCPGLKPENLEDWQDWGVRVQGARFVVAWDSNTESRQP